MSLDFNALAAQLLQQSRTLLPVWLPGGRVVGNEFEAGDLSGSKGSSLRINLATGKWADFASEDKGGDLISLYAAINGVTQAEAYKLLGGETEQKQSDTGKSKATVKQVMSAPADAPDPPDKFFWKDGDQWVSRLCTNRWTYHDAAGLVAGHVCRFDWFDDNGEKKKDVIPQVWALMSDGTTRWAWKSMQDPRPLYNLPEIMSGPGKPVLIVEGEKAADAAKKIVGTRYVVTTSAGGSKAINKSNWAVLQARKILLWPDADEPGRSAFMKLGMKLFKSNVEVKMILTDDRQDGWDAADALEEGWDWEQLAKWAKTNIYMFHEGSRLEFKQEEDPKPEPTPVESQTDPERIPPSTSTDIVVAEPALPINAADIRPSTVAFRSQSWPAWGFTLATSGFPLATLDNAVSALEKSEQLRGIVWFDEFLGRMITNRDGPPREWEDHDNTWFQLWMQRVAGIERFPKEPAVNAIKLVAKWNRRNCVTEWLESLEWDGVERISSFFNRAYGAAPTDYTAAVSRNFWVSIAARSFDPGCQVDNMVVLEGGQGSFKSSSLKAIAGPWFADMQETARNAKAFAEILQGKMLIEIAELDSFSRTDMNTVKRIISARDDRYRDSYGDAAKDHPRRCVLVGTTNEDRWNKDHTGARRFWPIRCGRGFIDIEWIRESREQLFAEAVMSYRRGDHWYITPDEETRLEQLARYDDDPWQQWIEAYLESRTETTVNAISEDVLDIPRGQLDKPKEQRIAKTLRHIGWERRVVRRDGKIIRVWAKETGSGQMPLLNEDSDDGIDTSGDDDVENDVPF